MIINLILDETFLKSRTVHGGSILSDSLKALIQNVYPQSQPEAFNMGPKLDFSWERIP